MRRSGGSCWGIFPPRNPYLMLLVVSILALLEGSAARPVARVERRREQEKEEQQDEPQGDDSECLRGMVDLVRQQGDAEDEKSSILASWTAANIASPCNHSTSLVGITCNNSRVAAINLSGMGLVGAIPSSLAACYFLQTLDLSWNSLSGSLPAWLGGMAYLSLLSLSNNNLSGPIPYDLATLASLTSLDLTHNQLSGSIPPQVGLLSLQIFNVSNNNLIGRIPTTLSNTSAGAPRFDASCFADNLELYGYPLPMLSSAPTTVEKDGVRVRTILFYGLVSGLGSLTISCYGVWLWMIVRKRHETAEKGKEADASTTQKQIEDSNENFGWKEALEHLRS